ncbi:MAG: EamA family transporter RarD, partial [Allosphingosinicella sp.]
MTDAARTRSGLLMGLGAYALWGVLPLYFKALVQVRATEIVAHRILWSLLFLGALATLWRKWPLIRAALANRRVALTLLLTAILIGINWLVYIYAVVTGHVLEGSLGYYLNPLVNVLFGVILLKERLTRPQVFACLLAAAGVAVMAAGAGSGLWISITLALSFASYGFLRKVAPVDSLEGLWIETLILAPVSLAWILVMMAQGTAGFGHQGLSIDLLLILGGAVTAL